mgnify:CR=1 FL=1
MSRLLTVMISLGLTTAAGMANAEKVRPAAEPKYVEMTNEEMERPSAAESSADPTSPQALEMRRRAEAAKPTAER